MANFKKEDRKDEEKIKVLELAIKHIQKEHGEGSIMRMGDNTKLKVEVLSTGSIHLNNALGVDGLPRGRIIEIYGPESSGKTTIALHAIAEAQRLNGVAAFIDVEHALDPNYAERLGVNPNEMLISQPDTAEQALDIADVLVRSGAVDVIVLDSVAALVPKVEIEGEMEDQHIGIQARLMSKALRKLTGNLSKSKTLMIFINQIRDKVATFGFGPSETTSGGRALKFYASIRLDVRRTGSIKNGDQSVGNEVKVKVTKNKVAPPFKEAHIEIMYGKGISPEAEVLDLAVSQGLVNKSGSWFSIGDRKLAQGKEATKKVLEEDKTLFNELRTKVLKNLDDKNLNKDIKQVQA